MSDRPLLVGFLGFAVGILLRSFFDLGFSAVVFALFLGVTVYCVEKIETRCRRSAPSQFLLALFIFTIGTGMLRFDLSEVGRGNSIVDNQLNTMVVVSGIVSSEPDERESSARLTVTLKSIFVDNETIEITSKALVVTNLYPKYKYGDTLEIFGELKRPKNFADDSGKIFDYESYLAKEGIYHQIDKPKIKLLSSGQGNYFVAKLFDFKQGFISNISAVIPEPHASLLGGLVVGTKQSLGKELLDDFRRAGVIHIVVLSGYNITIVAEAIIKFFSFLPRYLGQSLGATGIVLFAIMTGGSATVVRASIMALLVILARSIGRQYDITRALLFAGFLMVLQNPKILVFDSSFQLSFMSTLALIYVSPILEKRFQYITEKFGIRSVVVATLSTQIFVLPMLLYKMGELSLVALPVNFLILFIIPATMLFGFLAGMAGFVSSVILFPFAYIAYGFLAYELWVVEFFSHLPFASIAIKTFPFWFAVVCYAVYLILFLKFRERKSPATSNATGLKPASRSKFIEPI